MEYQINASVSLVDSLQKSRGNRNSKNSTPGFENFDSKQADFNLLTSKSVGGLSRKSAGKDDDVKAVLNLEIPRFDSNRKFDGIEKIKISKKNRHDKAIEEYSSFLGQYSEGLEKEVLEISRKVREDLALIDEDLERNYKSMENESFLLSISENEILDLLKKLKNIILKRQDTIDSCLTSLGELEDNRALRVGKELKSLVDSLIGIAHKLPDEIEHIIETETYDLNVVIATNRKSYAELNRMLLTTHIEIETNTQQRWENSRKFWRVIHHNNAIECFHNHMKSTEFTLPTDRSEYLLRVRENQEFRHHKRLDFLHQIQSLTTNTITISKIETIQNEFSNLNEDELNAIQECYNQLTSLRQSLGKKGTNVIEALRQELHEYSALYPSPNHRQISENIQQILDNNNLTELWLQAPTLKLELYQFINDFHSNQIVHNDFIQNFITKVDILISGFPIKDILIERGRPVLINQIRNVIIKMKLVSRTELFPILEKIIPELQELVTIEKIPGSFRKNLEEIATDMAQELERVRNSEKQRVLTRDDTFNSTSTRVSMTSSTSKTMRSTRSKASRNSTRFSRSKRMTEQNEISENMLINPLLIKQWHRRLSILFFSSEIPIESRSVFTVLLSNLSEQVKCNETIDHVIHENCDAVLVDIDNNYKKLIDEIANFLEFQARSLSSCTTNICNFYREFAKIIERHRKDQHNLDEKTLDELHDWKEDHRFEREDNEVEFENLCLQLKQSVSYEALEENFQKVLILLDKIQNSYRNYHLKATYLADKHPLNLIMEFKEALKKVCDAYDMKPMVPHPIEETFDKIVEKSIRLNKRLIGVDYPALYENYQLQQEKLNPSPTPPGIAGEQQPTPLGSNTSGPTGQEPGKPSVGTTNAPAPSHTATTSTKPASGTKEGKKDVAKGKKGGTPNPAVEDRPKPVIKRNKAATAPPVFEILSLNLQHPATEKFGGKYVMTVSMTDFTKNFFKEPPAETEEEERASGSATAAPTPQGIESPKRPGTASLPIDTEDDVHASAPWLLARVPLLTKQEIINLIEEEKNLYVQKLVTGFVPLEQTGTEREKMTPEQIDLFDYTVTVVTEMKLKMLEIEAAKDRLAHSPPKNVYDEQWVSELHITAFEVECILIDFRDNIIESLEKECNDRLFYANQVNEDRKAEVTEELEERLRTHWPRRGFVETTLKQPRAAELAGHEEKTYRHIQAIHEKVKALSDRFGREIAMAKKSCDEYVQEVGSYRTLLTSQYKTLAALQGVEVKARASMLSFQSNCASFISRLKAIAEDDLSAIHSFAADFRKICPLQEPGKEGGYSELEIAEIERLVNSQLEQMKAIGNEWTQSIEALQEQQQQSLKNHADFTQKYEAKVQEVALSESLGQKYGAPRRRAQGRLRSETARDEQVAHELDDLLTELETAMASEKETVENFVQLRGGYSSSQVNRNQSLTPRVDESSPPSDNTTITTKTNQFTKEVNVEVQSKLSKSTEIWKILEKIRKAAHIRAYYLKANIPQTGALQVPTGSVPVLSDLPWISEDHQSGKLEGTIAGYPENNDGTGTSSKTRNTSNVKNETKGKGHGRKSIQASEQLGAFEKIQSFVDIVEEVEGVCKKETKELYTAEGKSLPPGKELPESLQEWITENREKLLGPDGYIERMKKRFWFQIDRLETLLGRKREQFAGSDDQAIDSPENSPRDTKGYTGGPETTSLVKSKQKNETLTSFISGTALERDVTLNKAVGIISSSPSSFLSAPITILRLITIHSLEAIRRIRSNKEKKLDRIVKILVKARELHERSLRPRLGTSDPDACQELEQLNITESQRSQDLIENVMKCRSSIVREVANVSLTYAEELGLVTTSMIKYLDSTFHLGQLSVPTGVEVPKKHLTAKRLRKVQRLKQAVEQGEEDRSKERIWPPIPLEEMKAILESAENMVRDSSQIDKGSVDQSGGTKTKPKQPPASETKRRSIGGKGEMENVQNANALMKSEWEERVKSSSAIRGGVSTAHRIIVEERNSSLGGYLNDLSLIFDEIREKYDRVLQDEAGWCTRWSRQVEILKSGVL